MMRSVSRWYQKLFVCLIIVSMPFFGACRSLNRRSNSPLRVAPASGQTTVALDAGQIVELGRRAGLGKEEIIQIGPQIRNTLASHGSCRIYQGQRVYMIIAVQDRRVYGSLHTGGTFIYDLEAPPATE